ncbi:ELM1/GtrOC1 family putative glycosyltransferase [Candidatus Omnitrophota bacterium]
MKKDSLIDFLGFIVVKVVSALLYCTPLSFALWIGRRGGYLAYLVNSKRRRIAYANLKSAFPEKESSEIRNITKSHFENLGMSAVELLKVPFMGRKYLERYVSIENIDKIREAHKKKKGIIFLTAHVGNWEVGSLAVSAKGYRVSIFVREQKYARLNNLLNKYREMMGCKVVTKGFSVRDIIRTLNDNGMVAMLADQDAGSNGVFVDFLGRPASTAQGAVAFGIKTSALIFPSFMRRVGYDRHVLEISEQPLDLVNTGDKEKDVKANLEKIGDALECFIKRFPDQWLWSHKRWKSSPQRTVLILNDGKAGHFNQSMAVAEMFEKALASRLKDKGINERPVIKTHVVKVEFRNRLARALLDLASCFVTKKFQGNLRWLRLCLKEETYQEIKNRYADVVISCGASTIGANIFLTYENNAKNVYIMKPGLARNQKFNMVILPRHDAPKKIVPNMLIIESSPNRITEESMKEAIASLKPQASGLDLHVRGLGLLIGGNTKTFKLRKESVEKVAGGILRIAEEKGLDVFASTSRRTSAEIDVSLKDRLGKDPRCKLLVVANEKNIDGAVPAIFGLSEVIIVSSDSISMISEAISSGKYVVVFKEPLLTSRGEQQNKHKRSIEHLEKEGYIKTAAPDEIYKVAKEVLEHTSPVKKLEDRGKIIERLKGVV